MNIQDIRQEVISATLIPAFMAGTAGAYQGGYQSTYSNPRERRLTVDNQLGFSELLQGILGSEMKILSGRKDMFQFAMNIDELEELLEQDDIYALFWINQHIKKKGRAEFLMNLENDYIEAQGSYDETDSIEGIKRHFVDGMQYVYCYLKSLPMSENTRADAVKWFLSGRTKHNLGLVLVAYAIGYVIEAMLEE